MKNIQELRDSLLVSMKALADGELDPKIMNEMSNGVGKIINTTKVQIQYNASTNQHNKKIKFLECE